MRLRRAFPIVALIAGTVTSVSSTPASAATSVLPTMWSVTPAPHLTTLFGMSLDGRYVAHSGDAPLDRMDGFMPQTDGAVASLSDNGQQLAQRVFTGSGVNIVVLDRATGGRWQAFPDPVGSWTNAYLISGNGAIVAVSTELDGGYGPKIFLAPRGGPLEQVPISGGGLRSYRQAFVLSLSTDGRYLLYTAHCQNNCTGNGQGELRVWDRVTRTTRIASVSNAGVESNAGELSGSMSPNGRYVVFQSAATNLAPGTSRALARVYVRDLVARTTTLLPFGAPYHKSIDGAEGVADSGLVVYTGHRIVPDGQVSASTVIAYDLATGQTKDLGVTPKGAPVTTDVMLRAFSRTMKHLVLQNHENPQLFDASDGRSHYFLDLDHPGVLPPSKRRVLDTRRKVGIATSTPIPAGKEVLVQITGKLGITAASGAVVLNLIVVAPQGRGHARLYPCGADPVNVSNINFELGANTANLAVVKIGAGGKVCLRSSVTAHFVIDMTSALTPTTDYVAVAPIRVLDTRLAGSPVKKLAANTRTRIRVAGLKKIPFGIGPLVANIAVVGQAAPGTIRFLNCADPLPTGVNATFVGTTKAQATVLHPDPYGDVCAYSSVATHLVIDIQGYVMTAFGFSSKETLLDTRLPVDSPNPLAPNEVRAVPVPAHAQGLPVVLGLSVISPAAAGSLRVFPCGARPPGSVALEFAAGKGASARAVVAPGAAFEVCVTSTAATHVVVTFEASAEFRPHRNARVLQPTRIRGGSTLRVDALSAAAFNVTATSQFSGFLTVYPCSTRPMTSSLNFTPRVPASNLVIGPSLLCIYASQEAVVSVDRVGGFVNLLSLGQN